MILLLLLLCALLAAGQKTRIVSEGGGSNQDLEFDVATGILSITNGTGDTIPEMVGATGGSNGASGLVPQPLAGQESLFLRGDGTYANPSTGGDNWGSQVVQKTARFSGDGTAGSPLDLAQQSATSGQVLKWNGSSWAPAADTDTNTDAQTLSLVTNTLSISGGNGVSLAAYLDNTDAQTLSLATNTLSISGGNNVSLAPYLDNTDGQTLTFTESTRVLAISGGNSPDLSEGIQEEVNALIVAGTGISKSYNDGGNTLTISSTVTDTDDQTLSLAGTLLSISEGNSVDIAGIDTDDQTLSFTSPNLSISGGNSVNLSELLDNQVIDVFQIVSNTLQLSLEGDGEATKTVSLAPYLDNTDAQTLSIASNTLSISGGNGVSLASYLDNTDAQTLSFTEGTRALDISGGNSVDLSEGIQEEVNALIVAGTGISKSYNDGANTLTISATSTGDNIYNVDGALTDDRFLNTGGFELDISTSNSPTAQRGLILRSGYSQELANHFPLTIVAGAGGVAADSVWFVSYDTNLSIATNTNGLKYGQENTFTNPRHIVDKAYVDAAVAGVPASAPMNYLEVGASSSSSPTFSTTFSKLTHLTSGDDSGADWAWSTSTDAAAYSGATKVGFIHFSVSFRCNQAFNEITFVIRENGSETMAKAIGEVVDSGVEQTVSGVALVTFNSGDTFEIGGYSFSSTPIVTVRHCNMTFFSFN